MVHEVEGVPVAEEDFSETLANPLDQPQMGVCAPSRGCQQDLVSIRATPMHQEGEMGYDAKHLSISSATSASVSVSQALL